MGRSNSSESSVPAVPQSQQAFEISRTSHFWLLVVTALLLMRVVETPDLWWTLARGRQVISGSLTPSSDLLTLDSQRDADWLSGTPFCLVWSLFGSHAIAAIPLIAGCFLIWRLVRIAQIASDHCFRLLVLPLSIIPLRAGLTADPVLWDLALMMWLGTVLRLEKDKSPSPVTIMVTFMIWGNVGPRPIWGLLLLLAGNPRMQPKPMLILAAFVGGMLNPRGLYAWWDSLATFSPFLVLEPSQIYDPAWYGLFSQPQFGFSSIIFAVVWIFWLTTEIRSGFSFQKMVVWAIPMLACLISISNLPLAAAWILISKTLNPESTRATHEFMFPRMARGSLSFKGENALSRAQERATCSSALSTQAEPVRHKPLLMRGLVGAVSCLVLVDAIGWSGASAGRLAWGIASINDVRFLNVDQLPQSDEPMVGWTYDRRSASMIAWLEGPVVAADHPQRALLGGRWDEHAQVMTDLISSHRAEYQLEDGSWGGWVAQLNDWDVELLFIPAASEQVHAALIETPWKPFDLDSPVVPYLNADDISQAEFVVESLRQQGFVESGPWQPTLAMLDSQGWRFDLCAAFGMGPDPESVIRQSQLFRALDLPTASLRVLLPVRQISSHQELQREFQACQIALAYQEWVTFGETSEFRRVVVMSSDRFVNSEKSSEFWQSLQHSGSDRLVSQIGQFLQYYDQGQIIDAIEMLKFDSNQQRYARAMLWLELGDSIRAHQELHTLSGQTTDPALHYAAQFWIEQIAPYVSR